MLYLNPAKSTLAKRDDIRSHLTSAAAEGDSGLFAPLPHW